MRSAVAHVAPAGWWLAAVLEIDRLIERLDPPARERIRDELVGIQDLVFQLDAALATATIDLPKPLPYLASFSALSRTHEVVQAARATVRDARVEVM